MALSCQLSDRTHLLIKECMAEFSQVEPVQSDKILQIGQFHLHDIDRNLHTWDSVRDAVINEITVKGRVQPPAVVVILIQGFLKRLPLPRLLHFVDLVLPQMVPVCSPAQSGGSTFPGSQLIRDLWIDRDQGRFVQEPEIKIMRLFHSHAGIEHLNVNWNGHPLLLFADMESVASFSATTMVQWMLLSKGLRATLTSENFCCVSRNLCATVQRFSLALVFTCSFCKQLR